MFDRIPWSCFAQTFVIDGNSSDGTREYIEQRGVRVIRQTQPGLGAAMIEARQHCTRTNYSSAARSLAKLLQSNAREIEERTALAGVCDYVFRIGRYLGIWVDVCNELGVS